MAGLTLPGAVRAASPIAEVVCESTEAMRTKLTTTLRSTRLSMGLRGAEEVMEIWADPRGDWTMVITYASGQSCIVAMGQDWMDMPRKDPA